MIGYMKESLCNQLFDNYLCITTYLEYFSSFCEVCYAEGIHTYLLGSLCSMYSEAKGLACK